MATDMPGSRVEGRVIDPAGATVESSFRGPTHRGGPRWWTTAHTEAARFVGECIGAGAVLGMVAAMSRARRAE
jgi:hypothetical protein